MIVFYKEYFARNSHETFRLQNKVFVYNEDIIDPQTQQNLQNINLLNNWT